MLYAGCHLSSAKGYEAMGKAALALGANTFQFFTRNPRGGRAREFDRQDAQALNRLRKEHGFGPVVAHAPYTINPCSAEARTREFALESMAEDLSRLEFLEDCYYNLHPGSHVGQGLETGVRLIAETLDRVLRPGQKTVVLLETVAGKGSEVGGRFEELRAILDIVQRPELLGVCLDTCHVSDAGYDMIRDLDGVLTEFDRAVGLGRLRALHLNDSKNPPGSRKDRHQCLGEGTLGLDTFAAILRHDALRGLPMVLETPNEPEGYAREIALLRKLALDAEAPL